MNIDQLDLIATASINGLDGRYPGFDRVMEAVTLYALPLLVALVALQWWRRGDRQHLRHVLVAAGLSFLLGLGMNQLVLLFFHRIRPYDAAVSHLLVPPSSDWSFPSDHATATMAIAATFLLHRMPRAGLFFLAASLLVMFSRVYVGIHYVGDVLGGAVTGVAAAAVVWAAYREGTRADRFVTGIL